jgi:hypothetical protein
MASAGMGLLSWNWLPLFPVFIVYFISGLAETNRHPFDVVEGESEIVAGHMIEYSGMSFAMFFLAEYANMILVSDVVRDPVPGGLAAAVRVPVFHPGLDLAGDQGLRGRHHVPVGAGHLPALPLRPDHATGLEDLHPHHADLAGGGGSVDADPAQHLEMSRPMAQSASLKDFFSSFVLLELFKGMKLTGRHFFQKQHHRPVP